MYIYIVNILTYPALLISLEFIMDLYVCCERLEAFGTWIYRNIMRIAWPRNNKILLNEVDHKRSALSVKRGVVYWGHTVRQEGLQRTLIEGMVT